MRSSELNTNYHQFCSTFLDFKNDISKKKIISGPWCYDHEFLEKNKNSDEFKNNQTFVGNKFDNNNFSSTEFVEISPLDFDLENSPRKELSSIPLKEVDFPKIVYMIVDKNIELEIKLLKDYPEWEFLPNEDLQRKTIEIYCDLKLAKRACSKEHKVIKVPNTDVFRIVSPILLKRGISRIVSADKLISL